MHLLCQGWCACIQPWQTPRSAELTLAFHVNRGSVADPGTRQGMSCLTQTVTLLGNEVKLHRIWECDFCFKVGTK